MIRKVLLFAAIILSVTALFATVTVIPTDNTQTRIKSAYAFAWAIGATNSQWTLSSVADPALGASFGEMPLLWIASGENRGCFVYPDTIKTLVDFSRRRDAAFNISSVPKSYSLTIPGSECIKILKSSVLDDFEQSTTWELSYFVTLMQEFSGGSGENWFDVIVDSTVGSSFGWNVRLLVIPAFETRTSDPAFYMHQVATRYGTNLTIAINNLLSSGGTVYAEGNAGYLLELLGIIPSGTVDLTIGIDGLPENHMLAGVATADSTHPMSFVRRSAGIYTVTAPRLSDDYNTILRFTSTANPEHIGLPAVIEISGTDAHNGKILISAGIPTAGIISAIDTAQWMWSANAMLSAFCEKMLFVRSVHSPITIDSTLVSPYSIPADDSLSFEIHVRMRNLWNEPISGISLREVKSSYLYYVDCPSGLTPTVSGNNIDFAIPTLGANAQTEITYRLRTPDASDPRISTINSYIFESYHMRPSQGVINYANTTGARGFVYRSELRARVLFSANIVADADLNWKNILGEYFQPFKIFTVMENKERTSALQTTYMQMIPIDVPVYWVAPEEIPIIRTPGGQFVDVLRGTADRYYTPFAYDVASEYDMDGDGEPDAALNFETFHPLPDSFFLDSVFWFNPWIDQFEDINHDGIRPIDTDGDGIVDVPSVGDKIRVWRTYWNIGENPLFEMSGYAWYDPYVSWELWIDPPPLMDMAIGAAEFLGLDRGDRPADDTGYLAPNWRWWMERNETTDEVILVRLIGMSWGSYEGFRFERDTSYRPPAGSPTETDLGIIPYPRREYICVLNLGGHEPTMTRAFPPATDTLYSKISYNTIWGKHKTTPFRLSYTYYAPLPNPLQFEYVNQTFTITDPVSGNMLPFLPSNGDAYIDFKVTASTEYSRYWLANVGRDLGQFTFDYSSATSRGWNLTDMAGDSVGDGVFGYIMVSIPKGVGDYALEVDESRLFPEYQTLIHDNPAVPTEIFTVEYPFKWELYCPQILIPPALDDDDFDGIDDWEDDLGDRFLSSTGYLVDLFPPRDGYDIHSSMFESTPWDTTITIEGDLATAHGGWYPGADGAYGDDLPEKLGETHLSLRVLWHGYGYEGQLKINDGATLVNEEIFGGSPWVQWSHALFADAKGNHIVIQDRNVYPTTVTLYPDTVFLRYRITDTNEPHYFDDMFDPNVSASSDGLRNIVVRVGGNEPASLFEPDITTRARIDLAHDIRTVRNIAAIDDSIFTRVGYVRNITGSALTSVIVEVDNASGDTWDDVRCELDFSSLGTTHPVFWYGVYPRPFVPAFYNAETGEWIPGDDPRTFRAGWRFNPSEREVLFMPGESDGGVIIPEVQSSRRVYFIFHIALDPTLAIGVYDIPVRVSGTSRSYFTPVGGGSSFSYEHTLAQLAIVNWTVPTANAPAFVIAPGTITGFWDSLQSYVTPFVPVDAVWKFGSQPDPNYFDAGIYENLPGSFAANILRLDVDPAFETFPPNAQQKDLWFMVRAVVDAPAGSDRLLISRNPQLGYNDILGIQRVTNGRDYYVTAHGPAMLPQKSVFAVNNIEVGDSGYYVLSQNGNSVDILLAASNAGNDMARQHKFFVQVGTDAFFDTLIGDIRSFTYDTGEKLLTIDMPDVLPGEKRFAKVRLDVPATEATDVLELCYAFTTEFSAYTGLARTTEDFRIFTETDPDTIFYGANLFINENDDVALSIPHPNIGDAISISATVHFDGNTKFTNIPVRITDEAGNAIEGAPDAIIPEMRPIDGFRSASVAFPFVVKNFYEKLFITLDPDSQFGEIRESDNVVPVEIFTGKGDPVVNIVNYPNPFKNYTEFVYTVTRPLSELKIEVYTSRGRLIRSFDCPTGLGYNSLSWDGTDGNGDGIANGSYIYTVKAKDTEGKTFDKKSVAVRMK